MPTIHTLTDNSTRLSYTTKETAAAIRWALKTAFPGVKFSVTTSYASMTSSTHVRWTDGPTQPEVERITGRFTSRGFDGMTDCTTYHEQEHMGQRVQFSGWVTCDRRVSAALLQKALDRYNRMRAQYGYEPAALSVQDGGYPHLVGDDTSRANPCGGSATWCPDAVYQMVHTLRSNGCVVTMKARG